MSIRALFNDNQLNGVHFTGVANRLSKIENTRCFRKREIAHDFLLEAPQTIAASRFVCNQRAEHRFCLCAQCQTYVIHLDCLLFCRRATITRWHNTSISFSEL